MKGIGILDIISMEAITTIIMVVVDIKITGGIIP
jgi:hypothetical protein